MNIPGPLIKAKFIERPNRFLTRVELNGKIVDSHLPDPGRLKELLVPGAELYLRPVLAESNRKTRYTTIMVKHDGILISLVSVLPNRFVQESLECCQLPVLEGFRLEKAEVSLGKHRFDFLLKTAEDNLFYLEVKSVTLVEDGLAKFPDAVTERGTRHVKALENVVLEGQLAFVLKTQKVRYQDGVNICTGSTPVRGITESDTKVSLQKSVLIHLQFFN